MAITDKQIEKWREICQKARADCKSYQCPICHAWVIFPDSHYHKAGK